MGINLGQAHVTQCNIVYVFFDQSEYLNVGLAKSLTTFFSLITFIKTVRESLRKLFEFSGKFLLAKHKD